MQIKSYQTKRFAGLKDVNIDFKKGINVILGDNETGKSSVIDGINATLFKKIKLSKRNNEDKEFSFKFMPHPQGDFIDGQIVIETEHGDYEIYKEWGSTESIGLITPKGNIIKNEEAVLTELSELFRFGENTYNNIVFAKQRDLKKALENIVKDSDITEEINDVFRKAMMELDGVSVNKLEKTIEEELEELYKRWDKNKNYPENNRGINNPYKTGLGKILESYYLKEQVKMDMEWAEESERKFDEIHSKLKNSEEKLKILFKEVTQLEAIEEDVNQRMVLETKISSIKKDVNELAKINNTWPEVKYGIEQTEKVLTELKDKRVQVEEEKANLEKIKIKVNLEKKIKELKEINIKIADLNKEIKRIPVIDKKNLERLTKLQKEILTLETAMQAGKMLVLLKKTENKPVFIQRDCGDKEELKLNETVKANGFISINYDEKFEVEIKTGEIDFDGLNNGYKTKVKKMEGLLNTLEIESIEEGKLNFEKINDLLREIKANEEKLAFISDGNKIEELLKEFESFKKLKGARNKEDIETELRHINSQEIEKRTDLGVKSDLIRAWQEKYMDQNGLLNKLVEVKTELKDREIKLENLKPLPKEYDSPQEFKNRLAEAKEALREQQTLRDSLKENYYKAEKNLMDITFEELKEEQKDAEDLYLKYIRRGEKLKIIKGAFVVTKDKMSKDPLAPLLKEFLKQLDIITVGKYKIASIEEDFNLKIESSSGEMPLDLLSTGTYDSVALALRLSILKHLFEKDGFVVLDDCLVDLDPSRKNQAISLITDFAKNFQVIFTTCDPETAQALGGNLIRL